MAERSALAPADPWAHQRARVGWNTLVRVINVDADSQEFLILSPQPDLRDLEFDGATVILPEAPRTAAEAAEILARFDARYFSDPQQQQTRLSVLGRERYLRSRN
jgi:hypothetical protein